ncbi:MAG: S8 family serine peptidase [Candidatus Delongbacteria bacterium]
MRIGLLIPACVWALGPRPAAAAPGVVADQALVRFQSPLSLAEAGTRLDAPGWHVERLLSPRLGIALVRLDGLPLAEGLAALREHPALRWAQADHFVEERLLPDDSAFAQQWALQQASDADIDAPEAWDLATGGTDPLGRRIVVAVVDGGMDLAHPDLAPNVWTNPGESQNGLDDDGNGYVDDLHGWNAYSGSGSLVFNGHGTHVSGIVGARGNNLNMVCGVNWDVELMTVCGSSTTTSVAVAAYNYVLEQKSRWLESAGLQGANVVAANSSFGVNYANCAAGEYPAWNDMYDALGAVGVLSVAATMNINANVDLQGDVPTSCPSDFLITCTNTTNQDLRNPSSAYGALSIDLGAPGTQVLSTYLNSATTYLSGTSMSAPHVSGAVALLHAVASDSLAHVLRDDPPAGALALKELLLEAVDPLPTLAGLTVTGGRLNLGRAAAVAAAWPPPPLIRLTIVHQSDQRLLFSWDELPAALAYQLEQWDAEQAAWLRLVTVTEPSWLSPPHLPQSAGLYRVRAELP